MAEAQPDNYDLSNILRDWPFEPGSINVRVIQGDDQLPKIQVRLDLDIIQMNIDGRPDGQLPNGFASLLEYFEARVDEVQDFPGGPQDGDDQGPGFTNDADYLNSETDEADLGGDNIDGDDDAFETSASDYEERDEDDRDGLPIQLDADDCRALREEAAQYYHRYVALLVLEDFEGVLRDTSRNMRVADLCRDYAAEPGDRTILEQVRPYIIMMRARAVAGQALKDDVPKAAVNAIEEGISALNRHFTNIGEPEEFETAGEVQSLRAMRDALVPKLPVSQKAELRDRLKEAVRRENYELAAILRNELRMLGD